MSTEGWQGMPDWRHMGRERFDRIVEALAHRLYGEPAEVFALDGRGGDGGRDIVIRQGDRLRIAQLKYFPEGLSGGWSKRREQVNRSWRSVRGGHKVGRRTVPAWPSGQPYEWIVVMPCKLTASEREFLERLVDGTDVRLGVWDQPWLDSKLAQFPDLASYALNDDELRRRAKDFNAEQAILAGGLPDLVARLGRLKSIADAQDPDWGVDVSLVDTGVGLRLRAKHPAAARVSPISLTVRGQLTPTTRALATEIERAFTHGLLAPLHFPAEIVRSLSLEGPAWISHELADVDLTLMPGASPADGKPATLIFTSPDGVTEEVSGAVQQAARGSVGASIAILVQGACRITLRTEGADGQAELSYSLDVAGTSPGTARRALTVVDRLRSGGTLEIEVDGRALGRGELESVDEDDLADLRDLLYDLHTIERNLSIALAVPPKLEPLDRLFLRVVRLMAEGHRVQWPGSRTLGVTLNGKDGPVIRGVLTAGTGAVVIEHENSSLIIEDLTIPLPRLRLYSPGAELVEAKAALAALDAGRARDFPMTVRPLNDDLFQAELVGAGRPTELVPWNLSGFTEPVPRQPRDG